MKYDIIGDIHGHADELRELLSLLQYTEKEGHYSHPERKAVFTGDFIDRGLKNEEVLDIVMPMVNSGSALAVMGNHEYNAICYHTKHPETGEYLRKDTDKNKEQHEKFLAEFEDNRDKKNKVIDWFKTLPLFLDFGDLRIVHAEWDTDLINKAIPLLQEGNQLTFNFLLRSTQKGSFEHEVIETLLKGSEIVLPSGLSFNDKDNNKREEARVKWWHQGAKTYRQLCFVPEAELLKIPEESISAKVNSYNASDPPVFCGHYWLEGPCELQAQNVVCVDYSVAEVGGKLCSYSWERMSELHNKGFNSVQRQD